jgi:hypothetical protein
MNTQRNPRADVLIGLLFALILMGVLVVILSDLFLVTFRAQTQSIRQDNLVQQVDAMLADLRRDTWSAATIQITNSQAALKQPAGDTITWHQDDHGTLTRTAGRATKSWQHMPPITFTAAGPLLKVTLTSKHTAESITFISQQMQAGAK